MLSDLEIVDRRSWDFITRQKVLETKKNVCDNEICACVHDGTS